MCGVKTHIVTSLEVTPTETADAPQFVPLVATTACNFPVSEISADKAYSSRKNLHAAEAIGAIAYIPFKSNTSGMGHSFDGLWNRMWYYYNYNRADFMKHYHKRSNAETTLSMIKGKFGGFIRSKMPVAQVNEVLCKVLCHNICVIIQSIHELGIEADFIRCLSLRDCILDKGRRCDTMTAYNLYHKQRDGLLGENVSICSYSKGNTPCGGAYDK